MTAACCPSTVGTVTTWTRAVSVSSVSAMRSEREAWTLDANIVVCPLASSTQLTRCVRLPLSGQATQLLAAGVGKLCDCVELFAIHHGVVQLLQAAVRCNVGLRDHACELLGGRDNIGR